MITIALVGLPNVGKSTLFNRLVGHKKAIVNNTPGITRDRNESNGSLSNLEFKIIDTGGVDKKINFSSQIIEQVQIAVDCSDIIMFVVDAKTPLDEQNKHFAKWLRKITNKPIILIANKCESYKSCYEISDLQYLNFIGPVYISAEHNLGFIDLYEVLSPIMNNIKYTTNDSTVNHKIKIAVIGQPNVGKSTFINSLLEEKRVITSLERGTTRDAIDITYFYKNNKIILVDTAGMRKRTNITDNIETLSVKSSISSIRKSNIVILMIDATQEIQKQDLTITEIIIKEGKGLIISLNKWDLIPQSRRNSLIGQIKQYNKLSFQVPIIETTAIQNINCHKIIDESINLYHILQTRIITSRLNQWLISALTIHQPPLLYNNKRIKLKYITQIKTMPPTFIIMSNNTKELAQPYKKYLLNHFRKYFCFDGVPIRFTFRKGKNPYGH